jgi:DNA primase
MCGAGVSPKFDSSLISRVQQATDIVEIISEHLSLTKKGKEMVGLCPFHADHKPSMYVNPAKQIFKCFACGAGGDVIKFIQLRENLSFAQAIGRLAERAGIKLEPMQTDSGRGQEGPDPSQLARVNAWVQKFWTANLKNDQKGRTAREYIEQRKITEESVQMWLLGYATESWDELTNAAKAAGISQKMLVEAGLGVVKNTGCYDKFRNRLMFPIVDATERVIGFGGRTLGDDPAKYMNSPATVLFDKSNCLYGLDKARHEIVATGTAVVVEGYTDVIMGHQFGCKNLVAALGTSFTAGHARILRRYAKRIVLVFDSDIAGAAAANRALEVCLAGQIDIKLTFAPDGKDPCDFILTEGKEAFAQLVADSVDVMEYKWKRLTDGLDGSDNITDKRTAIQEFIYSVGTAVKSGRLDDLATGLIVTKLSGMIGVSKEQINRQLTRRAANVHSGAALAVENQKVVSVDIGEGFLARAQQQILEVLLNEPELFNKIAGEITIEQFDVPLLREIAGPLFEFLVSGSCPEITELLGRIESVEVAKAVMDLAETGRIKREKSDSAKTLKEAVDVLKARASGWEKGRIIDGLTDDDTEKLRQINKLLIRKNPRNPGMVSM